MKKIIVITVVSASVVCLFACAMMTGLVAYGSAITTDEQRIRYQEERELEAAQRLAIREAEVAADIAESNAREAEARVEEAEKLAEAAEWRAKVNERLIESGAIRLPTPTPTTVPPLLYR